MDYPTLEKISTRFFSVAGSTSIDRNSYIHSYPCLRGFFSTKTITEEDVVCGAHMIYGWMPRILTLYIGDHGQHLKRAAELLTSARCGEPLSDEDLEVIRALVNNSMVGGSKLLHFVQPEQFAIWDSRVFKFLFTDEKPHTYRLNDLRNYRWYLQALGYVVGKPRFKRVHNRVNDGFGYEVSALRAAEAVMFLNTPN